MAQTRDEFLALLAFADAMKTEDLAVANLQRVFDGARRSAHG